MYVILMKKKEPVCKIDVVCTSLAGPIVYDYKIVQEKLLPFEYNSEWTEEFMRFILAKWIESRVMSNSNPKLDQTMLEVYGLNPTHYGRMYDYQYIGGFLSYMSSSEDEYWVNPLYSQYLTYALVDPHFSELYICYPTTFEESKTAGGRFRKCLANP